ncbi:MAG: hypothetical protein ACP5HD_08745 [Thermoproteus sp.]
MLLGVVSDTHDDWVAIRSIGKLFRRPACRLWCMLAIGLRRSVC